MSNGRRWGSGGLEGPDGFFSALFDFRFSTLITTRIVRVVYAVSVVVIAVVALVVGVSGFGAGVATGLFTLLIVAPLFFVAYVVMARIGLELVIVLFQINDHVRQLAEDRAGPRPGPRNGGDQGGGPPPPPPPRPTI